MTENDIPVADAEIIEDEKPSRKFTLKTAAKIGAILGTAWVAGVLVLKAVEPDYDAEIANAEPDTE